MPGFLNQFHFHVLCCSTSKVVQYDHSVTRENYFLAKRIKEEKG